MPVPGEFRRALRSLVRRRAFALTVVPTLANVAPIGGQLLHRAGRAACARSAAAPALLAALLALGVSLIGLLVAGGLACDLPARRAARLDTAAALRRE